MNAPADHIVVMHGSLSVNVPRKLFKGSEAIPVDDLVKKFRKTLKDRYPWLTENGMDVLMKNARRVMLTTIDVETSGKAHAKVLIEQGKFEEAVKHLKRHLEMDPDDPDVWYLLGETLCKMGRKDEGYAAMNCGRDLF